MPVGEGGGAALKPTGSSFETGRVGRGEAGRPGMGLGLGQPDSGLSLPVDNLPEMVNTILEMVNTVLDSDMVTSLEDDRN